MVAKRKTGLRYACGKLKPQPKPWEPYRQEFISINRQHDGRKWVTSIKDEGTTALARLLYRHLLTQLEHDAGTEFADVWEWYRRLYIGGARGFGAIAKMERGFGDTDDERIDARAVKAYDAACRVLLARRGGWYLLQLVRDTCVFDNDPIEANLFRLKRGLKLLVGHFGLA